MAPQSKYLTDPDHPVFNPIVGRYANRIKNGKTYFLLMIDVHSLKKRKEPSQFLLPRIRNPTAPMCITFRSLARSRCMEVYTDGTGKRLCLSDIVVANLTHELLGALGRSYQRALHRSPTSTLTLLMRASQGL
jgi:hypothetical protein